MNFTRDNHWKHAAAALILTASATSEAASFNISLSFQSSLNSSYHSYFEEAAQYWRSVITGYADAVTGSNITGISIVARATDSDGVGNVLGFAGPDQLYSSQGAGGYWLAKSGEMNFDPADIADMISRDIFVPVIKHEMAHVLGFGTLWGVNNLYLDGTGQYTGQYALAAYKTEFNKPNATYVPVELDGADGTRDAHWDERANGLQNTGVVNSQGQDMKFELMTGWLNTPASSLFISTTTLQSFRDLGYNVAAVPLPGSAWLFASAIGLASCLNGKRRQLGR